MWSSWPNGIAFAVTVMVVDSIPTRRAQFFSYNQEDKTRHCVPQCLEN